MNLIKYKDPKEKDYVYFWVKEDTNVMLSPIFSHAEIAQEWLDTVAMELGLINIDKVQDKGTPVTIKLEDEDDASSKGETEQRAD